MFADETKHPVNYSYPLLIKNILYTPAVKNPDQEIIYRDLVRFSYGEFEKRVCRLANALIRMGVKKGDIIGVMDYDSHRYLECFFAIPMIGAVLHTVNIKLAPSMIAYTINHAEDDYLLIHEDFIPLFEQIKADLGAVKGCVLLSDEGKKADPLFIGQYEELLAAENDHYHFEDFDENTTATTFYTTGTTGLPKGVYFSHRQIVLHTMACLTALAAPKERGRLHAGDVYMPITPMFHVHAWGFPYIATFIGLKQVYPGKYNPNMLLNLIEQEQVTYSHCVPTILHLMMNEPSFAGRDLSSWKVVVGGSAMPRAICRTFMDKKVDIYSGYGMSETCPVLTISCLTEQNLTADEELDTRCRAGRPLPLVDLRVVDESMKDINQNSREVGEIVVRTPWLTPGYLKDSQHSEELWRHKWLHTGDVASINQKGEVNISDRMKDIIKVGGEWLSSLELEDLVGIEPRVAEVAVIAAPDGKWGERPLALVVRNGELTEKQILRHLQNYTDQGLLTRQALLMKVVFVDKIDKTSVGKIDKKILREKYLQ
ncbi:MAG: long-chain fatty acid--CoA ligase [Deltaproteobacteria bacterium]|nr:MAG: long-chain fatty acid--CoA ligase [Deltaproteobacteria bacterium]